MINRVILVGQLTRDAESTSGPSTTLTRMRLATNSSWRDADGNRQESAEFHSVVAFGKLGEVCAAYCLKGRRVYIEGRLRTRDFDGSDGLRRHSTEIVAETMKLLDRLRSEGDAALALETEPGSAAVAPTAARVPETAGVPRIRESEQSAAG